MDQWQRKEEEEAKELNEADWKGSWAKNTLLWGRNTAKQPAQ